MKSGVAGVFVVALALSFAAWADEEPPAGDLARLQGRWQAWSGTEESMLFEVKGNSFTLTRQVGEKRGEPWTGLLVIDESTSPKEVDWTRVKSGGKDLPNNKCIYEVHEDTWLLIGGGAKGRPERFFSGGGVGSQTLVFKRAARPEASKKEGHQGQ